MSILPILPIIDGVLGFRGNAGASGRGIRGRGREECLDTVERKVGMSGGANKVLVIACRSLASQLRYATTS